MNSSNTRAVMDRYFGLMGRGEDFATCYADDVRWTTFDGGTTVVGPSAVRDYVTALHQNLPDLHTGPLGCTDRTAYIEGDCADPRTSNADRLAICLAYDVVDGLITSARFYGPVGFLVPVG